MKKKENRNIEINNQFWIGLLLGVSLILLIYFLSR